MEDLGDVPQIGQTTLAAHLTQDTTGQALGRENLEDGGDANTLSGWVDDHTLQAVVSD